ncbi:MAG: hypothetical protein KF833_07640 [Verrucomicrobiae bacterium]|nr:hypothetical protein [Verrucomicrobiae bacterium]
MGWLVLVWTGCRTVEPFGPALAGQVREGQTRDEVRAVLGNPTTLEQSGMGLSVETYEVWQSIFGRYGIRDREEALEIRQFSVRYGDDGRVERTLYHRGVLEGWTLLYTRSVGPWLDPEAMARVVPGRTRKSDLESWFGPASMARLDPGGGVRLEWVYQSIEAAAVTPGRSFRALEVVVDEEGLVQSAKRVDRVFPAWRR